jgi:hypothetical protein
VTTIASGPSGLVNVATAAFEFASSEAGSTFACRLDTGAWSPCSVQKSYSPVTLGSHTFSVRATDLAGNTDPAPPSRTWSVSRYAASPAPITTVAGPGIDGRLGDGGPATEAYLSALGGLAVMPDGGYLIATRARVRRVDAAGVITTVAGSGPDYGGEPGAPYTGDGGPAASATFDAATAAAVGADGSILVADAMAQVIRRIASDGTITTVAGTLYDPRSLGCLTGGDGGPATGAHLCYPSGLSALAGGGFLIADSGNDRVRKVAPDGTITTVAGGGTGGDGGPATEAVLYDVRSVSAIAGGGFLLADTEGYDTNGVRQGYKVRKVTADGTISTVAGNGTFPRSGPPASGDGGPATSVQIVPNWVQAMSDGGFVFDQGTQVRRVDPAGVISTVAGAPTGATTASSADGLPATSAPFDGPGLALIPSGLLIIDSNSVRLVDATVITSGPPGTDPSGTAAFGFDSWYSGNSFQCQLDGAAWQSCLSDVTYTALANGTHTFSVRAVDGTGTDPTPATQTWTVGIIDDRISQAISFAGPGTGIVGSSSTLTATGGASGNPVTFSIDASSGAGVCNVSGTNRMTLNYAAVGTCVVDADQASDATYAAAPQVQQSVTVGQGSQAITFTSTVPTAAKVGGSTYTVSATGGASGNPVVFTADAASAGICTVSASTVSFTGAGTCTVDANQAGSANYTAAPQVHQSFAVAKRNQTITFASLPNRTRAQSPFTVSATASSGLTVTFASITTPVCTVGGTNGATITLVATGTCTVVAHQVGNAAYKGAPAVSRSFTVTKANQTITFAAPPNKTKAQGPLTVSATASSGLTVTFTTTTPSVCTAGGTNGATVTLRARGTCTIVAHQAGNGIYNAATPISRSFTVT